MAKRSSLVVLLLYALIATSLFAGVAAASGTSGRGDQVADELVIRFDGSLGDREEDDEILAAGAQPYREVDRDLRIKLVKVRPTEVASTAAKLRGRRGVAYVEPNFIVHAIAPALRPGALLATDPRFGELWGLRNTGQVVAGVAGTPGADISAATAWDTTTGSSAVVVGIVDTGIAYAHPDLAANVWSNPGGVGGCPAGTHGFNAINSACDPNDDNDHGSHVSGTIGAVGANGVGVVGVNWTVRLMGLKFLNAAGSGTTAGAISAIDFAVRAKQAGVNVRALNNSWGGGGFSQALLDKINQANAAGILFVAAAGNNGTDNDASPHYPSSYNAPNVVAVAATDNRDGLASFSNFGATSVHLGAPGVGILSTVRSGYASFNGTSMATPHVTGVAALTLAVPAFANLTVGELKTRLLQSVDLSPSLAGITVTGGRLNAAKAVGPAAPPTPDFALSVTPATQTVTQGATATYTVNVNRTSFTDPVSLSVSGLPADATATFTPNPATGASSTLTVATTATTTAASYPFTVTGTGGTPALTRTASATLVVSPPAPPSDFSLSLSPTSVTLRQGRTANYTVTITRTGGFSGSVVFSVVGLPAGWSATFTPSSTTGTTAQLAVQTTRATAPGTYSFTVQGTSGALRTTNGTVVLTPK